MTMVASALERITPALSALLNKPLSVVQGDPFHSAAGLVIRATSPRLSIVGASDAAPFTDSERLFLAELLEVFRSLDESEARNREIEQRMFSLQRENLDLIVQNRALSEISARDTLTGLYSRWYVLEKLESEINRALRHGSPTAVVMLDIDHFKDINDTWGHVVGDQVLQWVGKTLRDSCRVYDTAGRYGGEEFCVVLPETKIDNTTTVAERMRSRLASAELQFGEASVHVTASFGIAGIDHLPEDGIVSSSALIDRADRALYAAKHRGRNRIELWPDMDSGVSH